MSSISPGPATNSGGFETRASDPEESGKLVSTTDGANSSPAMAANQFEQRCSQGGTSH